MVTHNWQHCCIASSTNPYKNKPQHSKVAGINYHQQQNLVMANMKIGTCLVLFLGAMLCAGTTAQSGCTSVLISLQPCLNYITGNSSTPSQQCCTQLANVVRSSPQCLCQVLNGGGSSLGITINQTQALALPGSCNVQTPPISTCNGKALFLQLLRFSAMN